MPDFNVNVNDITITPNEFLRECDDDDIKKIIIWLMEEEYITSTDIDGIKCGIIRDYGLQQTIYNEHLDALRNAYYSLSKEEEEAVLQIAKKFK